MRLQEENRRLQKNVVQSEEGCALRCTRRAAPAGGRFAAAGRRGPGERQGQDLEREVWRLRVDSGEQGWQAQAAEQLPRGRSTAHRRGERGPVAGIGALGAE